MTKAQAQSLVLAGLMQGASNSSAEGIDRGNYEFYGALRFTSPRTSSVG